MDPKYISMKMRCLTPYRCLILFFDDFRALGERVKSLHLVRWVLLFQFKWKNVGHDGQGRINFVVSSKNTVTVGL